MAIRTTLFHDLWFYSVLCVPAHNFMMLIKFLVSEKHGCSRNSKILWPSVLSYTSNLPECNSSANENVQSYSNQLKTWWWNRFRLVCPTCLHTVTLTHSFYSWLEFTQVRFVPLSGACWNWPPPPSIDCGRSSFRYSVNLLNTVSLWFGCPQSTNTMKDVD